MADPDSTAAADGDLLNRAHPLQPQAGVEAVPAFGSPFGIFGPPWAPAIEEPIDPSLVPDAVTDAKLAAELADWHANAAIYERRGWLLLNAVGRQVDVAFLASVPIVGPTAAPVIAVCVRIDYTNYDLWPPSVTFINPLTRLPTPPLVRAPARDEFGIRDALVDGHPDTGRPFLCLPGIREYHNHPQHSGDDWLLHRATGAGRIAVICERIWQRMILNVVGLRVTVQATPIGTQVEVVIAQGDTTMLTAQVTEPPPSPAAAR